MARARRARAAVSFTRLLLPGAGVARSPGQAQPAAGDAGARRVECGARPRAGNAGRPARAEGTAVRSGAFGGSSLPAQRRSGPHRAARMQAHLASTKRGQAAQMKRVQADAHALAPGSASGPPSSTSRVGRRGSRSLISDRRPTGSGCAAEPLHAAGIQRKAQARVRQQHPTWLAEVMAIPLARSRSLSSSSHSRIMAKTRPWVAGSLVDAGFQHLSQELALAQRRVISGLLPIPRGASRQWLVGGEQQLVEVGLPRRARWSGWSSREWRAAGRPACA